MNFEGIMLRNKSEKDIYYMISFICGSKQQQQQQQNPKYIETETRLDEGGQKVQNSSYKMN